MQLSNLIGQYHQNGAQPKESVQNVKGVENLTQTLRGMKAGNVFEGTVSSVKGSKVTLALSNGREISARMDGKVSLSSGQSMFFQVKSNDGQTIQIRPFQVDGESANLTLINALKAAGLEFDAKNLSMVNTMMQEQMSIDANSINQMSRSAISHPDIDVSTLVQLSKLGISISTENASQFENYQNDKQAIQNELMSLIDTLPETMSKETLTFEDLQSQNSQILSLITENLPEDSFTDTELMVDNLDSAEPNQIQVEALSNGEQVALDASGNPEAVLELSQSGENAENIGGQASANANPHSLASLLDSESLIQLNQNLKDIPELRNNPVIFQDGTLNTNATSADILNAVKEALQSDYSMSNAVSTSLLSQADMENVPEETKLMNQNVQELAENESIVSNEKIQSVFRDFFGGKSFSLLAKDVLEQQWLLRPEEVSQKDSVKNLYEKLDRQISQLEEIVKATGQERASFTESAADIRNNISFMNEINQTYTYVQIPLKMNGQNANGELYVYTNKKALAQGEKDLTAFLHLDMDHLGSTDVSVRMRNKEVSTNFYMENQESYALLEAHLPELEKRLEEKGYHAKISVVNESNEVNFVDNFLKKDQPSAGQLRRYSFDMRA